MKRKITFTYEYNHFEPGTKVTPSSGRNSLPPAVYTVLKCEPPRNPGDDSTLTIKDPFGTEYIRSGTYWMEVKEAKKPKPAAVAAAEEDDEFTIDGDLPSPVKAALEQAEHIIDLIDNEVPPWAHDTAPGFFDDVRGKVVEVAECITKIRRVTKYQLQALDGWESGVSAWIR